MGRMKESKYIRADLLMNKIEESAFFSAAEKAKIRTAIGKEPGEDVKPVVHAHWDENAHGFYSCSSCGCRAEYQTKYCPECGAKMDESNKESQQKNGMSMKNGAEDES